MAVGFLIVMYHHLQLHRTLTLYPPRGYRHFASASRATTDRSRMSRRPSERPASTHTSLPDPRPKLPAMWPVRVTSLSHVNKVTGVVWLILAAEHRSMRMHSKTKTF